MIIKDNNRLTVPIYATTGDVSLALDDDQPRFFI